MNVFQPEDIRLQGLNLKSESQQKIYEIKTPAAITYFKKFFQNRSRRRLPRIIIKILNLFNGLFYLAESFCFIRACYLKIGKRQNQIFIAGDPQGLVVSNLLSQNKGNFFAYWSLELWIEKDIKSFHRKIFKKLERWCNRRAVCTIEFGDMRCKILSQENKLSPESMIPIPNSSLGDARIKRNYFFNSKFNIPSDKKIVLYAGGMSDDHMLVEILKSLDHWPAVCVLVLHFTTKNIARVEALKKQSENKPVRVYFSLDPVCHDDLYKIYSAADIGLQFFRPRITNLKYADWCSGKLFQYMRAGVPVIAGDLPGYKDFIENSGFGVVVPSVSQIGSAIQRILTNETLFKKNCIKSYHKFNFRKYHRKFEHLIESRILRTENFS